MSLFDFDTLIDRRTTASVKWDVYKDKDILPMWVADMDFVSPPAVLEALKKRAEHGVFGYTFPPEELAQVIVERMAALYRWKIEAEWIIWLPGLVCGLNVVCRAIGVAADAVLTQRPIYPPFLSAPPNQRRILQTSVMVLNGHRWEIDLDDMRTSISPSTRLYLLCNPHNPCGRVFSQCELEAIAEICLQNHIVICADEIHCDLLLDQDVNHLPIASISPEIADQTITLMAPSKTFNIAGLGLSFAIVPNPKLREKVLSAMQGIVPWPNAMGYTAALAAYRDGQTWLDALLHYLRDNRLLVESRVNNIPGLACAHVEATYLAWVDTRSLNLEDPHTFFENAGVGLSNGKEFMGDGFLRLNFGCPRSMLEEALQRMENAIGLHLNGSTK